MTRISPIVVFTLACAGLAVARPVHVYEPFDIPAGLLMGASGGQCAGAFWPQAWTAGPFVKGGPSLSNPLALPSGGLRCTGTGPMEGWRDFCVPLTPFAGDLWISVLMRSLTPAPTETFFQLRDFTGAGEVSVVRVAGMPLSIRMLGAGPFFAGPASGVGATDLIVIHLHSPLPGVVEAVAYVNPSTPTSFSSPVFSVGSPAFHLDQVYMRITGDQQIDEIRIGDSFGAVAAGGGPCYADCNNDGALTVADFGCFQTRFVASDPYADCNGDLALTVADFGCFQTKFVANCP